MAALSLGLAASARKTGDDVDRVLRRAVLRTAEGLPADDPVWRLTRELARDWPSLRRNPGELEIRGQILMRAVERATWPAAAGRVDIEG